MIYNRYYRDDGVDLRRVWARGRVERAVERRTRRHCMVDM